MSSTRTRLPSLSAGELLELVADAGSFRSWDAAVPPRHVQPGYAADLERARARSGCDESVLTGELRIDGRRVAVLVSEFGFLGGSIGVDAAGRLIAAIERATRERLPLLAGPASGGTRMQEGTAAFVAMVGIAAAIAEHKSAGLPYLVYLRHPTTGGVMASWGSLGHVTVAEPGALLGFLGPRVYAALYGEPFPDGVQTAENLYRNGVIDGVIAPAQLPRLVARLLSVVAPPEGAGSLGGDSGQCDGQYDGPAISASASIAASRARARPGARTILRHAARDIVPLSGTGQGEASEGLLLAIARFGAVPCVVIAQDRYAQRAGAPWGPAALRQAQRGQRLSAELGLPLVTIIDTPGAALSREAEEGGLAGEIARTLESLVGHEQATVAVLLGEGTGGGALALLPSDVTIAAQHAWLAPLPPEGASVIMHGDTAHASAMAEAQGIGAVALRTAGIVDWVVPERPDAALEPTEFSRRIGRVIERQLLELAAATPAERLRRRRGRYRALVRLPGQAADSGRDTVGE
ncbi:carboxyl transferase domain-containing protein [Microterricola viridarii]|uniref:Acetyl-CoA carboxylase carboxyl transferase subunit beta n=1 Tax=Microterricola viridarii TaxID=412690 RepID=A0A1H1PID5_9MICO|nr:carboxyl transferase domain-containing protein [Microterricola viridarii]SDS10837.1 acetyl-CoA carboxylase carboxyl transferase subunit beta [Microterricola viridarii]